MKSNFFTTLMLGMIVCSTQLHSYRTSLFLLLKQHSYSTSRSHQRKVYSSVSVSDDRFIINSERVLQQAMAEMNIEGKERCPHCWFYKSVCLCKKVSQLSESAEALNTEIRLFMHYKEYGLKSLIHPDIALFLLLIHLIPSFFEGKTSNTGKLISLIAPGNCKTVMYGTAKADEAILALGTSEDKQVILLYPCKESKPISKFANTQSATGAEISTMYELNKVGSKSLARRKKVILCVIDSTWAQVILSFADSISFSSPKNILPGKINE